MALKEAVKFIKANLCVPVETLGNTHLINSAKTALSSKILGSQVSHYYSCVSIVGEELFWMNCIYTVFGVRTLHDTHICFPIVYILCGFITD